VSNGSTFRFKMKAVPKDPSGYYIPRWAEAENLTVLASDRDEAMKKATLALGTSTSRWPWAFLFESIEEIEYWRATAPMLAAKEKGE